jgi:hypothetical protein
MAFQMVQFGDRGDARKSSTELAKRFLLSRHITGQIRRTLQFFVLPQKMAKQIHIEIVNPCEPLTINIYIWLNIID